MNNNQLYANWIAYLTLIRREVRRFSRIWVQTLIPPIITTSLYFLIFGKLIGSRIGPVENISYIEYIAPGLIVMSILTNAYANVSSSFFSTKFNHNIEEQLVSPMPDYLIILGYVTGGVLRGISVGFIVGLISLFFTSLHIEHIMLAIIIIILTAIVFSFAGFLNGLYAKSFDDITIFPTFIITPLTYLGGVFYSISMLSPTWQIVAQFNPLFYVINGIRYAVLGFSDASIIITLLSLLLLTIVLFYLCIYLMKHTNSVRN